MILLIVSLAGDGTAVRHATNKPHPHITKPTVYPQVTRWNSRLGSAPFPFHRRSGVTLTTATRVEWLHYALDDVVPAGWSHPIVSKRMRHVQAQRDLSCFDQRPSAPPAARPTSARGGHHQLAVHRRARVCENPPRL